MLNDYLKYFWWLFLCVVIFSLIFGVVMLANAEVVKVEEEAEIDMSIIAQIESSGNPFAYNPKTKAVGLYQITPICLEDWNAKYKSPDYYFYVVEGDSGLSVSRYVFADLFNPSINYRVAYWYLNERIPQMLEAYKLPITTDNILWAYNAGIGNVKKGICPKETKNYIRKYHLAKGKR